MSLQQQQNESTQRKSQEDLTAFEFYEDKYKNFKAFVKKIASYYPAINKWSNNLDKINLAVFISLVEPTFKRHGNMGELFIHEMQENDVNPDEIYEDDMIKLHRYADLFAIMLTA